MVVLVLLAAAIRVCEASQSVSRLRPHSKVQKAIKPLKTAVDSKSVNLSERGGVATSSSAISTTAFLGCLTMAVVEKVVKRVLKELNVQFPPMLGGCIALFVSLLLMEKISPAAAEASFSFLKPGADLVAKWFSMLFVPGLVLLPLSPSIGSNMEVRNAFSVALITFPVVPSVDPQRCGYVTY